MAIPSNSLHKLVQLNAGFTNQFDNEPSGAPNPDFLAAKVQRLLAQQTPSGEAWDAEDPQESETPLSSQQWLSGFEAYVEENLSDNTLSVPMLAQAFAMSESTLLRKLKELTGLTPLQFLQGKRFEHAHELLRSKPGLSIAEVAAAVGYREVRSFSRRFKSRFGLLPSEM